MKGSEDAPLLAAGAVTGAVSALPGASGSTMLVVFGVYERLLQDISSLSHLRKDLRFFLVLIAGAAIGLFLCSAVLDFAIERWETAAMFLFAMLILCQIPDLKAIEGRKEPAGAKWWAAFAAGFASMALIALLEPGEALEPSVGLMAAIGAIFFAAKVLPGISGSTIMVALGIYPAFLDAVSELNLQYLLPMVAGGLASLVILARVISSCMKNHRTATFGVIMGLTVGSVAVVLVEAVGSVEGTGSILSAAAGVALGIAVGLALRRLAKASRERMTAAGIGIRRD